MATAIEAFFDGKAFLPTSPVSLEPNTQVRLVFEPIVSSPANAGSFLKTARSIQIEGPPDWASNLDQYLYGERK